MSFLLKMNNSTQHALIFALICGVLLVTACAPVFDSNPIGRHDSKIDRALIGEWMTGEAEKVDVKIENGHYKIDFTDFSKAKHSLNGYSEKIGGKNIFVVEITRQSHFWQDENNRTQSHVVDLGYVIFNYTFVDDNRIEIYPIDSNVVGKLIDDDSIAGTVDYSCPDQFSTDLPAAYCHRVIADPDVVRELVLDRSRNIFSEESIVLIKQSGTKKRNNEKHGEIDK